jgi:hypothetical protein
MESGSSLVMHGSRRHRQSPQCSSLVRRADRLEVERAAVHSGLTYGYYHSGLITEADGSLRYNLTTPTGGALSRLRIGNRHRVLLPSKVPTHAAETYWRERLGTASTPGASSEDLTDRLRRCPGWGRTPRSPAVYFVSRQRGSNGATAPAEADWRGFSELHLFSRDSCYVHFTRDYSSFLGPSRNSD